MEQKHDQTPPEEGDGSGSGSEVSMDEILTSLRSILEEDQGSAASRPQADKQGAPPEEEPDDGDEDDELVLTDVVEEGPGAPETTGEEAPGAGDAAHFDTLFTRGDSLAPESPDETPAPGSGEADPSGPGEGGAGLGTSFQMASGEAEDPGEPEGDSPFLEEVEGESVTGSEAGEESADLDLEWQGGEEASSPEASPSPIFGQAVEGAEPDPEEAPEPVPAGGKPSSEAGSAGAATGAVDTERLREVVNETVEEQVAQATRELDTRLAQALEPKIREVLQGFLEERLPALLQELAEAEIERIKRGE